MGKCGGVCAGLVSKDEYLKSVKNIISFLNGNYNDVIDILGKKMKDAAANLDLNLRQAIATA